MTSKFGYQIHNQMTYQRGWSADEVRYYYGHLERLNPSALLFLDDEDDALNCKSLLPDCAVVVRSWTGDEGEFHIKYTPQEIFNRYKKTPYGLIRNIGNEPNGYDNLPQLAKWYAEVMDLFGAVNIPVCVPNFGEGHPNENRLSELEPLWIALDKWHDLHYYAAHEYGTHRGMIFNEAGKYDVYPWRVGRFEALVKPYLEAAGHKVPNIILTECGIDDAHDGTGKRGWKDAGDEAWYIGQLKAAHDAVYHKSHYVGVCLFCYGNSGKQGTPEDWRTFDVSGAKTLHSLLEQLKPAAPIPTPQPPPSVVTPPTPTILLPKDMGIPVSARREGDTNTAAVISNQPDGISVGEIATNEAYSYYPATATGTGYHTWYFVQYGAIQGWAIAGALGITMPAPEPPPDTVTFTRGDINAITVALAEMVVYYQQTYNDRMADIVKRLIRIYEGKL